jgi:hypothetical protein
VRIGRDDPQIYEVSAARSLHPFWHPFSAIPEITREHASDLLQR